MLPRATAALLRPAAAAASRAARRAFGISSSVDPEAVAFPNVRRGTDIDLNASLAADNLTTRGDAYRNASVRDLIEFADRGSVKATKLRAVLAQGKAPAAATVEATDAILGAERVVDVEVRRMVAVASHAP